jgi:hypothetical protein
MRHSEVRVLELGLLILATWLAMRHQRMLIVFGIVSAPVLCRMLSGLWDKYDAEGDRPVLNGALIALCLSVAVVAFPSTAHLARQVEEGNPVKAVKFLKEHTIPGRMLNEYVYGGYLIWAAPEHPVFIDGRADVFDWTGVLSDYAGWASLQKPPNVLLNKYNVAFCLLSQSSPMARVVPLLPDWKIIYSDTQAVIVSRVEHSVGR